MGDAVKRAGQIPDGGCFRKPRGKYVYIRVSQASAEFFALGGAKVYGIAYNGNMTALDPETRVVPMALADMLANEAGGRVWHLAVTGRP